MSSLADRASADVSAWAEEHDGRFGTVAVGDLVGASWLAHRADVELLGAASFLPGGGFADGTPEDLEGVAEQILSARQELAALEALLLKMGLEGS